ncbi:MAG: glycosylase, partial [Chitinophagaceae bacterium]
MKKIFFSFFLLASAFSVIAQSAGRPVNADKMQAIYEEVKTPYKYGLVIVPKNDSQKIDCPTVFRRDNKWYMSYIIFDGRGYETWLAKSDDLLNWENVGRTLQFSDDSTRWDANQKAGYASLIDTKWGGDYSLDKYKGKYWMSYFGGKEKGYESGLLSIGMAYTEAEPTRHYFRTLDEPVLTSLDEDVRWWENKKLFKSIVIRDKKKTTGYPFVMYYNANGDTAKDNKKTRWFERIGMAVSSDMKTWRRFQTEPVVHHPVGITGDPQLQKLGDVWVMFYFGAFWQDRKGAFNRFAASYDLVNWTDWTGENLIESSEPFDELYAHKPYVVKH